uniref:non-specific serine/threonine protein kinase n=1 Tax=Helianthus annuus TaxID=4232 RepID=A0A251UW39_HELAN
MNSKYPMVNLSSFSPIHFLFYSLVTDHEALLKIKSLITRDPYGALTSWNDSLHLCNWSHVYCGKRHRRVTYIDLSSQGLEGSLSPHVGNLSFHVGFLLVTTAFKEPFLKKLIGLSNNELVGSIPKEISSLTKLTFLSLFNNKLTGGIPTILGNITSLELFSVRGNPLGGGFPNILSQWKNLREFYARGCNLTGTIPHEIGHLSRLTVLSLANNKFCGVIPTNISGCSNLEQLYLSDNELVGSIPKEISTLTKLTVLSLFNNKLTGGIPTILGNNTSLELFSVAGNPLGGTIPDTLGLMKSLKEIYFGGCNLYGTISNSLYNLSLLANISLSDNQLTGGLYSAIGARLPNLVFFQLWGNQLSGPLPASISNCTSLELLELGKNKFSGPLKVDFSKLTNMYIINIDGNLFGSKEADEMKFIDSLKNYTRLQMLSLAKCKFQGVLPRSIGNLSNQLQELWFADNQLYGNLPSSIGNLVGLNTLALCGNQFTGNIPSTIGNLQNLEGLCLDENQLSGQIPDSIGNLSSLITLYLSSNMLEGVIPSSLGNCHHLLELYLNDNKLNGKIPIRLLQLSSLSITLDLSRNNLFGSLPIEVGNLNMLTTLNLSDNNFSGKIPSSLGGCSSLSQLSLKGNLFQGMIPLSLNSLKGLVVLDISHNNLSGHIPRFFEKFKLEHLNLSYNDFEGEVPMVGVFANESAFSVLGNRRLCGGIIELGLPKCKETSKFTKKFHLYLIVTLVASALFTATCLAYAWCKKKRKSHLSQSSTSERHLKVSYNRLLKATNGFSESNLIGTGGYSSVYKGILFEDNDTFVAIKVLHLQNRGAQRSFMRECEAWRNLRHRNLLKIITSCSSIDFQGNPFKALVYEFMPNGSLHDWLHSSRNTSRLNLLQMIKILMDVANALDYIHNHCLPTIIHGDLKPSNILLDNDMVAHVGDFGLARFLGTSYQNNSTGIRGTMGYIAPEYGLGSEMTSNGDIYSFGILVLEAMTGKHPTDDIFNEDLSLHKFASMALLDNVIDIIDVTILNLYQEQRIVLQNNEENAKKIEECLTLTIKIGVACSVDSPTQRMDVKMVVRELQRILDTLENI